MLDVSLKMHILDLPESLSMEIFSERFKFLYARPKTTKAKTKQKKKKTNHHKPYKIK